MTKITVPVIHISNNCVRRMFWAIHDQIPFAAATHGSRFVLAGGFSSRFRRRRKPSGKNLVKFCMKLLTVNTAIVIHVHLLDQLVDLRS